MIKFKPEPKKRNALRKATVTRYSDTPPAPKPKRTDADRQKAYRQRQKLAAYALAQLGMGT